MVWSEHTGYCIVLSPVNGSRHSDEDTIVGILDDELRLVSLEEIHIQDFSSICQLRGATRCLLWRRSRTQDGGDMPSVAGRTL